MPISGIVVILDRDEGAAAQARSELKAHPRIELGPASEHRLPAVIDEPEREAHEQVWNWVRTLDGVAHADLVYVHLEEGK